MITLLQVILIGAVSFALACVAYEAITTVLHRRKLDKFAAAQRRTAEMVRGSK